MGFEAEVQAISSASNAADGVAEGVRGVNPAAVLPEDPAGMKGAKAVAKLARLKESWQGKGTKTASALDQYAQDLASAAERYRTSDDAARADLDGSAGSAKAV